MKIITNKNYKFLIPLLYFLFLAVLIMGPLLKRGYIFTMDMVFVPRLHIDWEGFKNGEIFLSNLPLAFVLQFLTRLISGEMLQKIILLFIFMFGGYAMYAVLPLYLGILPRLLSGTFYIFNPFVYERFMAGQWTFLLGYALFPVIINSFFQLFSKKKYKYLLKSVFLWTLATLIFPHYSLILGICFLVIFLAFFINSKSQRLDLFKIGSMGLLIYVVLNLFWIIPAIQNPLYRFNLDHYQAFATARDYRYGTFLNVLGMYGFWRDGIEVLLTKDFLPFWPFWYFLLSLPVLIGFFAKKISRDNIVNISLVVIGGLGLFLALGNSSLAVIGRINEWLFLNIPGLRGIREPQKFSSILVFSQAWFFGLGLAYLKKIINKKILFNLFIFVFLGLVLLYNYKMLWGASGQLKTAFYPPSWIAAEEITKENQPDINILILPWHHYMKYSISGRTIANPAKSYFTNPVLENQSIELMSIKEYSFSTSEKVVSLLNNLDAKKWRGELKNLKVGYIFINKTKEPEFEFQPQFLEEKNGFQKLFEDNYGILFSIE